MTTPPSLEPWYEALQEEPNNEEDDGSSMLEVLPRLSCPTLCVKTTSIKEKCWAIFIGDSLLRRTEGPMCQSDPPQPS